MKNIFFERSVKELKALQKKEDTPSVVQVFIHAYLSDLKKGNMRTIDLILNRVYGKPARVIEVVRSNAPENEDTPEQRAEKVRQLQEELDTLEALKNNELS